MKQLDSFTIEHFRGLKNLQLQGLGQINLLIGQNNSGKTTVLEALSCVANPLDGFHWLSVALRRSGYMGSGSRVQALKWLFPQQSDSSPTILYEGGAVSLKTSGGYAIRSCEGQLSEVVGLLPERGRGHKHEEDDESSSDDEGGGEEKQRGAKLSLSTENLDGVKESHQLTVWDKRGVVRRETRANLGMPVDMISLNDYRSDIRAAFRFSQLRKEGLYDEAVEVLRLLDPGVSSIMVLSEKEGRPSLFIEHKRTGLTPLNVCGDGMRRAVYIATTIPRLRGGILLVDEIESAFHVSALAKIFELLIIACKHYDVQLFATTHSLEAVDAILGVALPRQDVDLVSYRLENRPEGTSAVRLDEKTLATIRNDLGQEVR